MDKSVGLPLQHNIECSKIRDILKSFDTLQLLLSNLRAAVDASKSVIMTENKVNSKPGQNPCEWSANVNQEGNKLQNSIGRILMDLKTFYSLDPATESRIDRIGSVLLAKKQPPANNLQSKDVIVGRRSVSRTSKLIIEGTPSPSPMQKRRISKEANRVVRSSYPKIKSPFKKVYQVEKQRGSTYSSILNKEKRSSSMRSVKDDNNRIIKNLKSQEWGSEKYIKLPTRGKNLKRSKIRIGEETRTKNSSMITPIKKNLSPFQEVINIKNRNENQRRVILPKSKSKIDLARPPKQPMKMLPKKPKREVPKRIINKKLKEKLHTDTSHTYSNKRIVTPKKVKNPLNQPFSQNFNSSNSIFKQKAQFNRQPSNPGNKIDYSNKENDDIQINYPRSSSIRSTKIDSQREVPHNINPSVSTIQPQILSDISMTSTFFERNHTQNITENEGHLRAPQTAGNGPHTVNSFTKCSFQQQNTPQQRESLSFYSKHSPRNSISLTPKIEQTSLSNQSLICKGINKQKTQDLEEEVNEEWNVQDSTYVESNINLSNTMISQSQFNFTENSIIKNWQKIKEQNIPQAKMIAEQSYSRSMVLTNLNQNIFDFKPTSKIVNQDRLKGVEEEEPSLSDNCSSNSNNSSKREYKFNGIQATPELRFKQLGKENKDLYQDYQVFELDIQSPYSSSLIPSK